jgi:hypothetical protein
MLWTAAISATGETGGGPAALTEHPRVDGEGTLAEFIENFSHLTRNP